MLQSGKTLSMHNEAIWKGTYTNNGMLLKIHENAYTIGYSALLSPDGQSAGVVKFGDGVFYDAHQKDNKAYVGAPTVANAVPVFAGIMAREPAIASGYPVNNDEVASYQKGMLVKEGFIIYKKGFVGAGVSRVSLYDNANVTYETKMYVNASNGAVYFGSSKNDQDDVLVGKVVEVNPDDKSVTVYVSPALTA